MKVGLRMNGKACQGGKASAWREMVYLAGGVEGLVFTALPLQQAVRVLLPL